MGDLAANGAPHEPSSRVEYKDSKASWLVLEAESNANGLKEAHRTIIIIRWNTLVDADGDWEFFFNKPSH